MGATAVELPVAVERSRFHRFLRRFPMSARLAALLLIRSEEHTSELQSPM